MNRRSIHSRGFTLMEVMVAMAILAFGMMGLLGLQHQSLQSVIHAQEATQAAMLAQSVMAEIELQPFPGLGSQRGDFRGKYPGRYPNFRWETNVSGSGEFPDIRIVRVKVLYGPRFSESFSLAEFMHSRDPLPLTPQ
ncbi:MAG TPA: prepilin-type N-terminal cleavage/methylation domain-containing protein [Candidatus Binataceae bacterium]|nr:prepilin-type N-terminal cleavage/methylation domain-containing protein [Candidatus Binataceae bacterium]